MASAVEPQKSRWIIPIAIAIIVVLVAAAVADLYFFHPGPSLNLSIDKPSVTIQRGSFQTLQVSITGNNSPADTVSLSASGAPTSVTVGFSEQNSQLSPNGHSASNLTVTAGTHAFGQNSTLTITATSSFGTSTARLLISVIGITRTYNLRGSYASGWNPNTINATEGDIIVLNMTSVDSLTHAFYVDYNGNMMPDDSEPLSTNVNSPTVAVPFTFETSQIGTFTYYCKYHPNMTGIFESYSP